MSKLSNPLAHYRTVRKKNEVLLERMIQWKGTDPDSRECLTKSYTPIELAEAILYGIRSGVLSETEALELAEDLGLSELEM